MSYMKMMAMQETRNRQKYGVNETEDRYNDGGQMRGNRSRYAGGEEMRRMMNDDRYTYDEWTGKGYQPKQTMGFHGAGMVNIEEYRKSHPGGDEKKKMRMTKEMAEEWVNSMENEDHEHPEGETWSMEEVKEYARKCGIETEGTKFYEFYAMMNAMYSDYSKVAEKHGVEEPEFFADMAKAFLDDKDGVKNKAAVYYHCIVEK